MHEFNTPDPDSSTPSRWPARIAWCVIFALVAFVVYRNSRVEEAAAKSASSLDDVRIRMVGEELIGVKSLGSLTGQTQQVNSGFARAIAQLDESVRSPEDKLHVAIVAGEVQGRTQALERLDELAANAGSGEIAEDIAALRNIYVDGGAGLNKMSRDRLVRRHGYFANLAFAYGVPANVEPRKSIEAAALRTSLVLGFVGVGFGLLLLGSVALFIVAIVLRMNGKLAPAYFPDPSASTAYLEAFAIYFCLFILGLGLLLRALGLTSLQWEWLALLILPVVTFWFSYRRVSFEQQCQGLGWNRGKGVLREIAAGLLGYIAGIVVIVLGFAVTFVLIRRSGIPAEHPIIHMLQGNRWHVLGLYALVSVFAPLLEESMFRGALFHHLRRRFSWAISAPAVAFIFAIIHPQGWVALPVLGAIALVLAALREWRGSLIAPMVAHALNNFIALTAALLLLRQ